MWLHPGNMGVAEHGEAVRRQGKSQVQCPRQRLEGLTGKAIDEVDVDPGHSSAAHPFKGCQDRLERLHPVDCPLDPLVEILNAETDTCHSKLRHGLNGCFVA